MKEETSKILNPTIARDIYEIRALGVYVKWIFFRFVQAMNSIVIVLDRQTEDGIYRKPDFQILRDR